jgi:hypothetical protein
MSSPVSDVNEAFCWQCGEPADPDCAYAWELWAPASEHRDGQGYPVVRGKYSDVVKLRIPRCEACRSRMINLKVLFIAGYVTFCVVSVMLSSHFIIIVGSAFVILISIAFAVSRSERRAGRRSINDYPPRQRLRQAGWQEPSSN